MYRGRLLSLSLLYATCTVNANSIDQLKHNFNIGHTRYSLYCIRSLGLCTVTLDSYEKACDKVVYIQLRCCSYSFVLNYRILVGDVLSQELFSSIFGVMSARVLWGLWPAMLPGYINLFLHWMEWYCVRAPTRDVCLCDNYVRVADNIMCE